MRRLLVLAALAFALDAQAVTIDWVLVGNPNNAPDTATNCPRSQSVADVNCGAVNHAYYISKYETTNTQYAEFLNAVDAEGSNSLALYNGFMGSDAVSGGIDFVSDNPSGSKYVVKPGFESKPVTYVSFYDALRFANWLNNGQGSGDTETGAYTLLGGTAIPSNGTTVTRNQGAITFLPSENEWYKAAYYSPGGVYYDYPAGSDAQTACAVPGDLANIANCADANAAVTAVGAYTGSPSPYGTFDQGGNVFEWNEQIDFGIQRGLRGGSWNGPDFALASWSVPGAQAVSEGAHTGFRVASPVLEPLPIEWVPIANPNNAADTASNCYAANCGSVDHAYYISKYEVTNAQYVELLNAKAASDPLGIYNTSMGIDASNGGITRSGASGSYTYMAKPGFGNKPVTYVSLVDALRFANWLNNGKGIGATDTGAYTITPEAIANNTIARNPGAQVFLTSENEWYKAAYYSPLGVYFDFPTGTDSQTDCVAPSSDTGDSANCDNAVGALTDVGAYNLSDSPYGTHDQGGNVIEWNEQTASVSTQVVRGGGFPNGVGSLGASFPNSADPTIETAVVGFRVASLVPESDMGLLGVTAVLALAASWRRRAAT